MLDRWRSWYPYRILYCVSAVLMCFMLFQKMPLESATIPKNTYILCFHNYYVLKRQHFENALNTTPFFSKLYTREQFPIKLPKNVSQYLTTVRKFANSSTHLTRNKSRNKFYM